MVKTNKKNGISRINITCCRKYDWIRNIHVTASNGSSGKPARHYAGMDFNGNWRINDRARIRKFGCATTRLNKWCAKPCVRIIPKSEAKKGLQDLSQYGVTGWRTGQETSR